MFLWILLSPTGAPERLSGVAPLARPNDRAVRALPPGHRIADVALLRPAAPTGGEDLIVQRTFPGALSAIEPYAHYPWWRSPGSPIAWQRVSNPQFGAGQGQTVPRAPTLPWLPFPARYKARTNLAGYQSSHATNRGSSPVARVPPAVRALLGSSRHTKSAGQRDPVP